MSGWVVAAERNADPEQEEDKPEVTGTDDNKAQENHEDEHLNDEHPLAPEMIRQAAETHRADQDTKQARGTDDAMWAAVILNSSAMSGMATPVMKTTSP